MVGLAGAAILRRCWPPPKLWIEQGKNCNFNDLNCCVDKNGTLVAQWDGIFLSSNLNEVRSRIKVNREHHRITLKNIHSFKAIWGGRGTNNIFVYFLINNYNNWIGGVGVFGQRIS